MARVLVVDDEEGMRKVLRRALEDAGYEVIEAGDGDQALKYFKTEGADLVVLDVIMPGTHGLKVLKELREFKSKAKIIAVTGGQEKFLEVAKALGAVRVYHKPFPVPGLVEAVDELLSGSGE